MSPGLPEKQCKFGAWARRDFLCIEQRFVPPLACARMADVHFETVYFSGRVQGVGFRYSTLQVAKEFEVAGAVRNLSDGRVVVEAEGRAPEVVAFIAAIEERMHDCVRKVERSACVRASEFSGFTIR